MARLGRRANQAPVRCACGQRRRRGSQRRAGLLRRVPGDALARRAHPARGGPQRIPQPRPGPRRAGSPGRAGRTRGGRNQGDGADDDDGGAVRCPPAGGEPQGGRPVRIPVLRGGRAVTARPVGCSTRQRYRAGLGGPAGKAGSRGRGLGKARRGGLPNSCHRSSRARPDDRLDEFWAQGDGLDGGDGAYGAAAVRKPGDAKVPAEARG